MQVDVFTLFPHWFEWFFEQRHVRNAAPHIDLVDLRATTPLSGGQVDDTPYGGGAGMVIRVDVMEAALRAVEESFSEALEGGPEYPHYTRPAVWRGHSVPEVLLSGDHARIRDWRRDQSRERASRRR